MKKRLLSIVLLVSIVLGISPMLNNRVYANDETRQVKVRIEGKIDNLFEQDITVTDEVYGMDVLKTAVGEENIGGTESAYGFMVDELLGEKGEMDTDYSTSWGLYIVENGELISSPVGISTLKIDAIDEILLHIKATDTFWNDLTYMPKLEASQIGKYTKLKLKKLVTTYDENWNAIVNEAPVEGATLEIAQQLYTTDHNGEVIVDLNPGIYDVKVYKEGQQYPELIRRTFEIEVEDKIAKVIETLRSYYAEDDQFSFREAMGYHFTSNSLEGDLQLIQSKYKINESPTQVREYNGNIIGLIAAGKNPRDFQGENYVKPLVEAQKDNGKFIIKESDDYPTTIAFSILALDMAGAEYNIEKAVEALLSYQNEDGSFGPYKDIDTTSMSIMALGQHRNLEGVDASITKALDNIRSTQSDTGGFIAWGAENPYSAAATIQGLIAVGEDPLSDNWIKNGKTMLDSLLSFKVGNHFENTSDYGTEIDSITEQAFMALSDLYRGKSMYHEIGIDYTEPRIPSRIAIEQPSNRTIHVNDRVELAAQIFDEDDQPMTTKDTIWESSDENIATVDENGILSAKGEGIVTISAKVSGYENISDSIQLEVQLDERRVFEITRIDDEVYKNGSEARLTFNVKNNGEENKTITLITALYDKDTNKMINYFYVNEAMDPSDNRNLGGGFLIPNEGNYQIKAFVWDGFQNQNVLAIEPVVIEVEQ